MDLEDSVKKQKTRELVLDIISEIAPDVKRDEIDGLKDDVLLREQIELDSMDFLDIVMELRKKYGIEVPEEHYGKLDTLDSCADYLTPMLDGAGYDLGK